MRLMINEPFAAAARWTARQTGRPMGFILAVSTIAVWGMTGPFFGFSDTWQLVINTGTTIVTFLMVFLIQHSQNCEAEAVQVKLDELIRALSGAHNALLDLEELTEEEITAIRGHYRQLAHAARARLRSGQADTDTPSFDMPVRADD